MKHANYIRGADGIMRPPCIYLAGPMRGIKDFNFPAFHDTAEALRQRGYIVFNPAQADEAAHPDITFDGDSKNLPDGFIRGAFQRDLDFITKHADAIAALPGWEKSAGCAVEIAVAQQIGIPVLNALTMEPIIIYCDRIKSQFGETRITDPVTGGQKGQKLERFDLIPTEPLMELARVYGKGAQKYADDNWRKGYSWKLSFGAMLRHALLFWGGESIDAETGCHHLACVAWHCMTLMWFEKHRKEKDDRPDCVVSKQESYSPVLPQD